MANPKIDSIRLSGSDKTFDIDLPYTATPSIAGLTTSELTVNGISTLADVKAFGEIQLIDGANETAITLSRTGTGSSNIFTIDATHQPKINISYQDLTFSGTNTLIHSDTSVSIDSGSSIEISASTGAHVHGTNVLDLNSSKKIYLTAENIDPSVSTSIRLLAKRIGLLENFTDNVSPIGGVILKDGALNITMSATPSTGASDFKFIGDKDNAQITIGYTNMGYNRISTNPAIVFKYPESSDNGFAGIISLYKDSLHNRSLRIGSRDTTASMGTYYCLDVGDAGFTVDYQENPWTEDNSNLINILTVDKNGVKVNKSNYQHNLVAIPTTSTTTISAASQLNPTPSRVTVNYLTADYFISNRCLLLIPTSAIDDSPKGNVYEYMRTDQQKKNIYLSIPCYKTAYIYYTDANSITLYYYQSASASAMTSLDLTSTIKDYGSLYFSNISIITLG